MFRVTSGVTSSLFGMCLLEAKSPREFIARVRGEPQNKKACGATRMLRQHPPVLMDTGLHRRFIWVAQTKNRQLTGVLSGLNCFSAAVFSIFGDKSKLIWKAIVEQGLLAGSLFFCYFLKTVTRKPYFRHILHVVCQILIHTTCRCLPVRYK